MREPLAIPARSIPPIRPAGTLDDVHVRTPHGGAPIRRIRFRPYGEGLFQPDKKTAPERKRTYSLKRKSRRLPRSSQGPDRDSLRTRLTSPVPAGGAAPFRGSVPALTETRLQTRPTSLSASRDCPKTWRNSKKMRHLADILTIIR